MLGKIINHSIKVIGFILVFWLLTYLTMSIIQSFADYNIFQTDDTPAIITEKISTNNLTSTPKYEVLVDLNEGSDIKNRVFSWQFQRLEVGDIIKGHYIQGSHFFTTLDIIIDSGLMICLLLLMLFFYIALLIWPIDALIKKINKDKKPNRSATYKSRPKKQRSISKEGKPKRRSKKEIVEKQTVFNRIFPKTWREFFRDMSCSNVLLIVFFTIAFILTGGFVVNGVQKMIPFGKTETSALVVDKVAEQETYYYLGKVSDPYYSLTLTFTDEHNKMYTVIKEVTKSVYKKHAQNDLITIKYSNHNPYNVYVPDYTFLNLLETFGYVKVNFFLTIFLITCVILSIHLYKLLQNKKKSS